MEKLIVHSNMKISFGFVSQLLIKNGVRENRKPYEQPDLFSKKGKIRKPLKNYKLATIISVKQLLL